jgi:hypothetical protein
MLTSIVASSGSSSRRETSTGPLTAARTEKRESVYVAEPSARVRVEVVIWGTIFASFAIARGAALLSRTDRWGIFLESVLNNCCSLS